MVSDTPWEMVHLSNGSTLSPPIILHIPPYTRLQARDYFSLYIHVMLSFIWGSSVCILLISMYQHSLTWAIPPQVVFQPMISFRFSSDGGYHRNVSARGTRCSVFWSWFRTDGAGELCESMCLRLSFCLHQLFTGQHVANMRKLNHKFYLSLTITLNLCKE